ncbi:MAG: type I restriction endonuclease subunit R [Cyanothece sp. SIO1E1]|nr:type I restriction endonuclease subunit R [Cyanothece sp. SIO1E1]
MTQALAISKTITSMAQLQERFTLLPAEHDGFFTEWYEDLPELAKAERAFLDKIKHRFVRHRQQGELAEGTVNMLIIAHLLELAGLYDEPFLITNEYSVEVEIADRDEKLRGRIDTLVLQNQFWSVVLESKKSISFEAAIPQVLAYMMTTPQSDRPLYGMVTDGRLYMFIKLVNQQPAIYDFSDVFSLLLLRQNKLYDVLRVLRRLSKAIKES